MYKIKDEFLDLYTVYDYEGDAIVVDLDELKWLSQEWEIPLDQLMDQVEEIH